VEGDITSFVFLLIRWELPLKGIPTVKFSVKMEGAPLCGIRTFILFIKMEADMVQVERRSGKERRSGRDRRRTYTRGFRWSGRPDSRERRSTKDRRKSPRQRHSGSEEGGEGGNGQTPAGGEGVGKEQ
jgi:hypothetical protein